MELFLQWKLESFRKRQGPKTLKSRPENRSSVASRKSYNTLRLDKLRTQSSFWEKISLQAAGQHATEAIKLSVQQTWQPENTLSPCFLAAVTQENTYNRRPDSSQ